MAPRGIRVNVVSPGATRTPIWNAAAPTEQAKAALDKRLSGIIPLGRLGTPSEFGDVVCFLASERASYVTGVTLAVDGGIGRSLL